MMCSEIQIYLKELFVLIHDHPFCPKEEMKRELLKQNTKEPFINDLYLGKKFKCYINQCNKKISKEELKKHFNEGEIEQIISNLNISLRSRKKTLNLKFHCAIIDYEESLKFIINELIEHNKITPVSDNVEFKKY